MIEGSPSVTPENIKTPAERILSRKGRKIAIYEEKMRQERLLNANIVLEWMGVREAVYSKKLREEYPNMDYKFGYVREDNGNILPAVEIRWDQESRKIHSDEHSVSKAVKIECDTQNDLIRIYYSSEEEIENEIGTSKKITGWKRIGGDFPGYHREEIDLKASIEDRNAQQGDESERNYLIALIADAMDQANGKIFDIDESSGRYGRII